MENQELPGFFNMTDAGISSRLRAIGIHPDDRARLAETWQFVEPKIDEFLTNLYERFSRTEAIRHFVEQEARVSRLKEKQKNYLRELFCGSIDLSYVEKRLHIGLVHYQLRITPQWYLAAACHFITELLPVLLQSAESVQLGINNVITLLKNVLFDAGLALTAYGYYEDTSAHYRENSSDKTDISDSGQSDSRGGFDSRNQKGPPRPMSRIHLSVNETQARMEFIGLEQSDLEQLRQLESTLMDAMPFVLDDFYAYISSDFQLRNLVPLERLVALKQQVATYWQELTRSQFDRPYAASRMRIGVIHEEIGLDPQNYLTGVARQVGGLLQFFHMAPTSLIDASRAFIRAVFYDITFVIDSYMEARASSLLHAEGLAGRVMKGLHSAVAVVDSAQRIIYANEKLVRLTGVDPALLRMMRLGTALPIPELLELLSAQQKNNQECLSRLIHWHGVSYQVTVTNSSGDHHQPRTEFIIVLDDVSRLQRVSDQLQQDHGQYQKLAEQVPAVLWQMNVALNSMVSISPTVFALTGFNSPALLGKPDAWLNCVQLEDRPRFQKCLEMARLQKSGQCQYRLRHRDGREFWVQTTMSLTESSEFQNEIISAVTVDITRLKTAERLRLSAISQMAAGVAHLLNNSLTTVNCSIELHAAETDGLQNAPLLESALRASARAASIAKQLQSFSGGDLLRPQTISLNQFLRSERSAIQKIFGDSIAIKYSLQSDLWLCSVDVDRLKNVVGNLCANAQQAMLTQGEIRIATKNVDSEKTDIEDPGFGREWIELSISDNGPGMSDEVLQHAIEPFYSERPLAERNGLGLSIAHGFLTQSGGHMLINSESRNGTTIVLRFPRPAVKQSSDDDFDKSSTTPVVLIVDDERPVLRATRAMVQYLGYRVITAENAAEALRLLETQTPDILLSDVSLNDGVDGYQLAQEVSDLHPPVAVILMSGWLSKQSLQKEMPADWLFLNKPYSLEEITSIMSKARDLAACKER